MFSFVQQHRIVFSIALFLAMATLVVWVRTTTLKSTYQYVTLEREFRKLQQEIQAERVEWLRITSPKRLEAVAKNLKLFAPRANQILKYENKSVTGGNAN